MAHTTSRSRRAALLVGAGLASGALLTGCGGAETRTAPAAATQAATEAPAADTGGGDLATGLLPATAFGAGATVTPLPFDQLGRMPSTAGFLTGVQRDRPECAAALRSVLPQLAAVEDAAAQVARAGGTVTAEALARPGADVDAVGQLDGLVDACSPVTVSAAGYGSATVTVTPLDVASVPGGDDRAAGVSVTVAASRADGGAWTGTALAALVQDGDRVLALAQAAPDGGQLDTASFTALLQRAYEVQADALD